MSSANRSQRATWTPMCIRNTATAGTASRRTSAADELEGLRLTLYRAARPIIDSGWREGTSARGAGCPASARATTGTDTLATDAVTEMIAGASPCPTASGASGGSTVSGT